MLRILIADDHEIIRAGLKDVFKESFPNAIIEEVCDGLMLVEKASTGNWDIVISDISMPGINGIKAMRNIHEKYPDLPVLIISTEAEDEYGARVLKAGAAGYLSKNSVPTQLVNVVRTILERGNHRPDLLKGNSPDEANLKIQSFPL